MMSEEKMEDVHEYMESGRSEETEHFDDANQDCNNASQNAEGFENGDGFKNEEIEETMESTREVLGDQEVDEYIDDETYKHLRSLNVKPKVAAASVNLLNTTDMTSDDLDDRAVELLRSFSEEHALFVLKEINESNLIGVQNKAQYLMSIMRNFRDKVRQLGAVTALSQPLVNGPAPEKIKEILNRTGYSLEVTIGQRKYGGPPPDWDGPATGPAGPGHEIYIGKIPKEVYEDTLIPLFEDSGRIWDLRLMMDPLSGRNRGYAFLTYCDKTSAHDAAKKYDGHEIVPGKNLKVNVSVANTRLFIGNIPKSKSKDEILAEFKDQTEGVLDCIIYSSPDANESRKNRGFCFLDFCDHKTASDAKRKINAGKLRPWNSDLVVDWAEQQEEPDEETMSKVKVLYVRNLREAVTEEQLKEMFSAHGEIDRAKKIRDYAFIHFMDREPALKAMEALNGTVLEGVAIDISLAKPQSDKKKAMRGRGRGFSSSRGSFGELAFGARGSNIRRSGTQFGGRGGFISSGEYYGSYDPYGFDDGYGYSAPPMGYPYGSGYDSYSYAPDPYGYGYGAPPVGMRTRGSTLQGGGTGFTSRGTAGRGRSNRISRGLSQRGGKRPGDGVGGPASKREFGADDFSQDVNMSSF